MITAPLDFGPPIRLAIGDHSSERRAVVQATGAVNGHQEIPGSGSPRHSSRLRKTAGLRWKIQYWQSDFTAEAKRCWSMPRRRSRTAVLRLLAGASRASAQSRARSSPSRSPFSCGAAGSLHRSAPAQGASRARLLGPHQVSSHAPAIGRRVDRIEIEPARQTRPQGFRNGVRRSRRQRIQWSLELGRCASAQRRNRSRRNRAAGTARPRRRPRSARSVAAGATGPAAARRNARARWSASSAPA